MTAIQQDHSRQTRQHSRAGRGLDPDRAGSLIGNGAAADDVPFNYEGLPRSAVISVAASRGSVQFVTASFGIPA